MYEWHSTCRINFENTSTDEKAFVLKYTKKLSDVRHDWSFRQTIDSGQTAGEQSNSNN